MLLLLSFWMLMLDAAAEAALDLQQMTSIWVVGKEVLEQQMSLVSGAEGYERALLDVSRGYKFYAENIETVREYAALGDKRRVYYELPEDLRETYCT